MEVAVQESSQAPQPVAPAEAIDAGAGAQVAPDASGVQAQGGEDRWIDVPSTDGNGFVTRVREADLPNYLASQREYIATLHRQLRTQPNIQPQPQPKNQPPDLRSRLAEKFAKTYGPEVNAGVVDLIAEAADEIRQEFGQQSWAQSVDQEFASVQQQEISVGRNDFTLDNTHLQSIMARIPGIRPKDALLLYRGERGEQVNANQRPAGFSGVAKVLNNGNGNGQRFAQPPVGGNGQQAPKDSPMVEAQVSRALAVNPKLTQADLARTRDIARQQEANGGRF